MMLTIDDVDVDYDVDVDVDYDVDVHYDIDVNYDVDVDYDDLVDEVPDALPPSLPLRESVCHPRNCLRAFQPLLQPDTRPLIIVLRTLWSRQQWLCLW